MKSIFNHVTDKNEKQKPKETFANGDAVRRTLLNKAREYRVVYLFFKCNLSVHMFTI